MASCQEVIISAINEVGAGHGLGEDPDPAELADALPILQGLYDWLVSSGTFGRATDVLIEADYDAEEGDRVFNIGSGSETITLPETVADDICGEDRAVRDYTLIRIAGDPTQTSIYTSPLGAFVRMTSLELADYAPLSERDNHGLACLLALRLARRFKGEITPDTRIAAGTFKSAISLKADAPRVPTQAEYY